MSKMTFRWQASCRVTFAESFASGRLRFRLARSDRSANRRVYVVNADGDAAAEQVGA